MSTMSRRTKIVVFSLLACALALPAVHAWALAGKQTAPPATAAPAAAARPAPKPLLWKVSDDDNAIYLLGSFHLLKTDDYPLSSDVDAAFAAADKVVFEVPPGDLTDPSLVQKMQALSTYVDGRRLTDVLPPELHTRLSGVLGEDRLAQLDAVEPWYINLSLLIGISQQMGFRADQGLDMHLAQRAEAANKPTEGLETVDDQLRVLDASPMEEQVAGLRDFVDKPGEVPMLLKEAHEAWRNGDDTKLGDLVIDDMRRETPETYRLVNVERNDAWVPKLRQMLDGVEQGDALVVVGAMHLLGDDGVVEKLRAQGYKVERICTACR